MCSLLLLWRCLGRSVEFAILCNSGITCLALVFTLLNKCDAFSKLLIWVFKYQCWRAFVRFFTFIAIVFHKSVLTKPANASQEQLWTSKVSLLLLFVCYSCNSVTPRAAQRLFSHVFSNHGMFMCIGFGCKLFKSSQY